MINALCDLTGLELMDEQEHINLLVKMQVEVTRDKIMRDLVDLAKKESREQGSRALKLVWLNHTMPVAAIIGTNQDTA